MFQINFKENLKKALAGEVVDLVEDQVGNLLGVADEVPQAPNPVPVVTGPVVGGPLHTDKYDELIELIKESSKNHIIVKKQQGKNLFAASSVIAIVITLLMSVLVQIDSALVDKEFTAREGIQIAITLVGAASSIFARGTEGKAGVYTPHGVWGPDKEDYDGDGIPNHLDDTPIG